MADQMLGDSGRWFDFGSRVSTLVSIKVILLVVTAVFAVDARLRIIPNLNEKNMMALAWHVVPVTIVSILFVAVGVSFRTGWFS